MTTEMNNILGILEDPESDIWTMSRGFDEETTIACRDGGFLADEAWRKSLRQLLAMGWISLEEYPRDEGPYRFRVTDNRDMVKPMRFTGKLRTDVWEDVILKFIGTGKSPTLATADAESEVRRYLEEIRKDFPILSEGIKTRIVQFDGLLTGVDMDDYYQCAMVVALDLGT